MTLTHPFSYWQRGNSYANAVPATDNTVLNRNEANNVNDLHVRSYLHSRVTISCSTTNPPPVDWFASLDWLQQGQWTLAPVTIMSSANDGNFGDMLAAPLVMLTHSPVAAPGRDIAMWASQKVESARVYHFASDDNGTFPSVQSGLTLYDRHNVLAGLSGFTYEITIHQYLETLWASKVPPA